MIRSFTNHTALILLLCLLILDCSSQSFRRIAPDPDLE